MPIAEIEPPMDLDGSALMCQVKSNSARRLLRLMNEGEHRKLDQQRGLNGRSFWKVSFRSLPLYTGTILQQKIDYTHLNPVRACLSSDTIDHRWNSARFWEEERFVGDDYCLNIPAVLGESIPERCWMQPRQTRARKEQIVGSRCLTSPPRHPPLGST